MPEAEFLRLAALAEVEPGDDLLGERAAHAFGDDTLFAEQLHAGLVVGLVARPSRSMPKTPATTPRPSRPRVEHLGDGKARIDLDAQRFRLLASQRQTLPSDTA